MAILNFPNNGSNANSNANNANNAKFAQFVEVLKQKPLILPFSSDEGEQLEVSSYEVKETKSGKTICLVSFSDGRETTINSFPQLQKALVDGALAENQLLGLNFTIAKVIKNGSYNTYLISV